MHSLHTLSRTSRSSLTAAALLLGVAAAAQAQSSRMDSQPGSYIGLNGGTSDYSRIPGSNGLFSNNNNGTPYGLTFGNYGANRNIGFEIGYTDFGSVSRGGGTTKADGINLSLIGRAPVSPMFNLLGKIGTTYTHTDVSASPLSGINTGSNSDFGLSYGVGAELVISPQWSAVLQYDETNVKFPSGTNKLNTTTVGVRMNF